MKNLATKPRDLASLAHARYPILVKPTLPNAIQLEGPLRIAHVAVRDRLRHPINLQHQTGRNGSRSGPLPSVFIQNRDGASFIHCHCQGLETHPWVDGENWTIGKGEQLREPNQISNGLDSGGVSQHCQKHVFDQPGIGQRTVCRSPRGTLVMPVYACGVRPVRRSSGRTSQTGPAGAAGSGRSPGRASRAG
jgi:hypothetical protein